MIPRVIELRVDKTDLGKAIGLLVEDAAVKSASINPTPPDPIPGQAERAIVLVLKPDHGGGVALADSPGHEPDEAFASLLRAQGITVYAHRMVGHRPAPS